MFHSFTVSLKMGVLKVNMNWSICLGHTNQQHVKIPYMILKKRLKSPKLNLTNLQGPLDSTSCSVPQVFETVDIDTPVWENWTVP